MYIEGTDVVVTVDVSRLLGVIVTVIVAGQATTTVVVDWVETAATLKLALEANVAK